MTTTSPLLNLSARPATKITAIKAMQLNDGRTLIRIDTDAGVSGEVNDAYVKVAKVHGELTGSQIRNLSAALQVEVLDRTMLILEIFRARATTNEGKLQTELATLRYQLPRLQGLGEALSRQGGGGEEGSAGFGGLHKAGAGSGGERRW